VLQDEIDGQSKLATTIDCMEFFWSLKA
jgi:hypothetical protein